MCSACCDISSSKLMLHPVGKDITEECEDVWSILKAKESHQVLGAHLLWPVVPHVTGRKSSEQHTSLPAQHKPFAELPWRQSWAVLQGLLSTQKSNDQYGQVSISMRHAHKKNPNQHKTKTTKKHPIKKKPKTLHSQRFPQFYFLEDFPWFPPKQRRFKYIYISIYEYIFSTYTTWLAHSSNTAKLGITPLNSEHYIYWYSKV